MTTIDLEAKRFLKAIETRDYDTVQMYIDSGFNLYYNEVGFNRYNRIIDKIMETNDYRLLCMVIGYVDRLTLNNWYGNIKRSKENLKKMIEAGFKLYGGYLEWLREVKAIDKNNVRECISYLKLMKFLKENE